MHRCSDWLSTLTIDGQSHTVTAVLTSDRWGSNPGFVYASWEALGNN